MKKMYTYLFIGSACSLAGILFMFQATREGRKEALAETEKNLVKSFNELDSIGRAEFITNAKLNKEEIIIQINNQTITSATEIITEVQNSFGTIEEDLEQKGKQINVLEKKTTPKKIAEDQKSFTLREFLNVIPKTNNKASTLSSIHEYLKNNRFDSKHLHLIKKMLNLSLEYPNGKLRYYILNIMFRDFPNEVLNNDKLYEEYTGKKLLKLLKSGQDHEIIKKGIRKNIEKLYANGGFGNQTHFNDLRQFFDKIYDSKDLSELVYQLVKLRHEKFLIFENYYLMHVGHTDSINFFWGEFLFNEFINEEMSEKEKSLLEAFYTNNHVKRSVKSLRNHFKNF
jgi:hypothetical protein